MTQELLQRFGKVLLQVKAVHDLLSLGSTIRSSFTEEFASISRHNADFRVGAQPRFARLHRTIREQLHDPSFAEIHQDRAILVIFLPRPLVYAHLVDGAFTGQRKVQYMTNDGFSTRWHPQR